MEFVLYNDFIMFGFSNFRIIIRYKLNTAITVIDRERTVRNECKFLLFINISS